MTSLPSTILRKQMQFKMMMKKKKRRQRRLMLKVTMKNLKKRRRKKMSHQLLEVKPEKDVQGKIIRQFRSANWPYHSSPGNNEVKSDFNKKEKNFDLNRL